MATYEARRQANIQRNKALVKDLGLEDEARITASEDKTAAPPRKKRKVPAGAKDQPQQQPTRSSARIRSAPARPVYTEDAAATTAAPAARRAGKAGKAAATGGGKQRARTAVGKVAGDDDEEEEEEEEEPEPADDASSPSSIASLIAGWTSWTPAAPAPELVDGDPAVDAGAAHYRFASHPDFRPNKSPEAILREGAFGGTYFRPLRPRRLPGKKGGAVVVVEGDWRELPGSWTRGLDPATHLASPDYDAAVNKFGVACGQSIEAWEAAGWISHAHDVRGWFQWYCRFWMGRRCGGGGGGDDDGDGDGDGDGEDERQIARWKRCVGERGRWRRALLRKYVQMGVRSVADEGDDEDGDEGGSGNNVSPVVHQTCHHWAWEVRQEVLDRFWEEEGGG